MPTKAKAPAKAKVTAPKPTSSKATSKAKAVPKATKSALKASSVADATPTPEPVVVNTAEAPVTPPLQDEFAGILSKLQQVTAIMSAVRTSVRDLEKKTQREIKAATKAKTKNRKGNRAPSGFVMPAKISDELASFLGKEKGSEMARTEVTREINAYIRTNKLQDKANGRIINADGELAKLLKIGAKDELTYFNLQRYMSPHFAKAVKKGVVKKEDSSA